MTFKKILVAYDFSKSAGRAVRFAAQLVKQVGGTLDVVYVVPDLYNGRADETPYLPPTYEGQPKRYLEFLREELSAAVLEALDDQESNASSHAMRGDPVKCIEELAKELKADAICVSATGKGAVERVLMGSTSQALLRTSSVPVLLVP